MVNNRGYLFVIGMCVLLPACKHHDVTPVTLAKPQTWDDVVAADSDFAMASTDRQKEFMFQEKHRPEKVDAFFTRNETLPFDVPVPFDVDPVTQEHEQKEQQEQMLSYRTTLTSDQLVQFYQAEMERLGWRQNAFFHGVESLLHFDKPQRVCSITIRPDGTKRRKQQVNRLTLFMSECPA